MDKKKLLKKLIPVFLVAAAMAVGITAATVLHSLTMENPIKTPTVEGSIPETVDTDTKKTAFKNDGEADVFLRVSWTGSWVYTYTNDSGEEVTELLPNETTVNGTTVTVATPNLANQNKWTKSSDGWYYYNYVLESGATTGLFVDEENGLTITDVVDNLSELADQRYKDADYQLHFVMEIVQASDEWQVSVDAVEELFGLDLGSTAPSGWDSDKYSCTITWPVTVVS